ncbi:MAG: DUF3488 and transglutaminase-like domain-containing protein [Betaproteobacteria bacterium]|nr:DUF3488 and transglutaminase-like domain-containing protein [Betaproteobacteria bacterium]
MRLFAKKIPPQVNDVRLIYGLLACILLVSAPHVAHLPPWVSLLCATLLGWRAYLSYRSATLPPRWLLLIVTLGSIGGILVGFHTFFGRDVGVSLLILLAALKLLELRTRRDAFVAIYLACFIVITNFLYSQSIVTALFMLVTLLAIVTTWLQLQPGAPALRPRLRIAVMLLLQAIPLMLVLFVLFPRVPGPLWGLPQDAYGRSGLDDKMSPGSLSQLSLSDAVAFRVTFNGAAPPHTQMYWRGPVLQEFDGRTWTQGWTTRAKQPQLDNLDKPVDYTVTLEPHNKTWLFALEMPTRLSIPAMLGNDFQFQQRTAVTSRLRYTAHSQLGYRANAEEEPRELQRALRLPPGRNPRTRQLAAEWRASLHDDEAVLQAALKYFNREEFFYTLRPPLLGAHSVDDFLFDSRKGFCEHYASSFVFLMRAAGIPARVVTGYQGGEYNRLGNYYIVRQSDAHAWAEVWLRERGWVRIDPTATIAPLRVQNGLAAAILNSGLADSTVLPFMARTQWSWLLGLRANLDLMTNQWNQWVLGYDTERQFAFLTHMGMEFVTWQNMAIGIMEWIALLVGLYALHMLRRVYVRDTDAAQRLYLKFCRKLARAGIVRAAHEGAQDFAARAARIKPQSAPGIADITARYVALRYGGQTGKDALAALRRAIATFKL